MRFAAFGRTSMFLAAVEACVAAGHEPALVATADPAPEYRAGRDDFASLAARLDVPFADAPELDEALRATGAEIAISMNWPSMVPAQTRDRCTHGVLNAHPGDLPRFRGNACPNWAILAGEPQVGLSVHVMTDVLDGGPIVVQRFYALEEDTYVGDVYAWLEHEVGDAFAAALSGLADGSVRPRAQSDDPRAALRCHPRRPSDGLLDLEAAAFQCARLVRASSEPFAGAFAFVEGARLTIWRARAEPLAMPTLGVAGQLVELRSNGEAAVLTGDGLLVLEEVELGGVRGPAGGALRSTRQRLERA